MIEANPDVADRLRLKLASHNEQQVEPRWPWSITTAYNVDRDLSEDDQPDDEFAFWSN